MKTINLLVSIILGAVFLAYGLLFLLDLKLYGVPLIVMSFLVMPVTRTWIYSHIRTRVSLKLKVVSVVSICTLFLFFLGLHNNWAKEAEIEYKQLKQSQRISLLNKHTNEYFKENRNSIISKAQSLFLNEEYSVIVNEYRRFLVTGDKELNSIYDKSLAIVKVKEKEENFNFLREKLKKTSVSNYSERNEIYMELVRLYPQNEKYQDLLTFYDSKVKKMAERKKAIEAQLSPWDGSHPSIVKLIKARMHDPDSFIHDETYFDDNEDHVYFETKFRGRNVFGGVVRESVSAVLYLDTRKVYLVE